MRSNDRELFPSSAGWFGFACTFSEGKKLLLCAHKTRASIHTDTHTYTLTRTHPHTHTPSHTHTPTHTHTETNKNTHTHTHTHTHLCNPPSGLIGNSQYHSSTSEEQGYEEDFGFASCHSRRGGDLQLARRPQERPRGLPAVTTDPGQPDPLDLQQVRLHAHSPMVFVGSSMGERPGAPCLKMEQSESKAWTVNSVTNLGKQVFPTHTLLCRVAMEAEKTPKKREQPATKSIWPREPFPPI